MKHRDTRVYRRFRADTGNASIVASAEEIREYWDALISCTTTQGVFEPFPDSKQLTLHGRELLTPEGRPWTFGDVRVRPSELKTRARVDITPPESGNQQGLTSVEIWIEFRGREVWLQDTIEGMHEEWADALVAALMEVFK